MIDNEELTNDNQPEPEHREERIADGITHHLNQMYQNWFLTAYGSGSMLRNNGGSGYRPGIVYDRLLEYYATNTTSLRNVGERK